MRKPTYANNGQRWSAHRDNNGIDGASRHLTIGACSAKRIPVLLGALLACALLIGAALACTHVPTASAADTQGKEVKILFTHDIHSNLDTTTGIVDGSLREYAGADRLATLLRENSDENTIYLDGGDFSMGTLYQAGFATDAYELRTLGVLGCAVTTPGNHEWDQAGTGFAQMLRSAMASGDPLPQLVISNLDFSGDLTEEQADVQSALADYGAKSYTIIEVNGVRIGIFGVSGEESIEDSPTSGMSWTNYIEAAQATVAEIGDQADLIVCLSHSGTEGDGKTGEDFDLIEAVPDIDVVISAHSHCTYHDAILSDGTILASAGEYMKYLGSLTLSVDENGEVTCTDYELIPVDETVERDAQVSAMLDSFKESIEAGYLAEYAPGASFDDVVARMNFDFITLEEMYATHGEYPLGDLIADSYLHEANAAGITDIDVALVGLGTIRGSLTQGDITTADAFGICSLGVGADGSAGHPLVAAYITGEELKLLCELDASLGTFVNSIKMSYSGLSYTFNENRVLLDRVTQIHLTRADGTSEEIEDDKLYKVCCNMYAANMLGMLNGLTKGILSIVPKYADGTAIEDFYTCSLLDENGREIKEWVAFRNYLSSFEQVDGVSTIPAKYADTQGRKVKVNEHGIAVVAHPGTTTAALCCIGWIVIFAVVLIVWRIRVRRKRKGR